MIMGDGRRRGRMSGNMGDSGGCSIIRDRMAGRVVVVHRIFANIDGSCEANVGAETNTETHMVKSACGNFCEGTAELRFAWSQTCSGIALVAVAWRLSSMDACRFFSTSKCTRRRRRGQTCSA